MLTVAQRLGERCPSCNCEPDDDTTHRDGCERVDTCGQFGPPWVDPPFHDDEFPTKQEHESNEAYSERCQAWRKWYTRHLATEHLEIATVRTTPDGDWIDRQ